MNKIPIAVIAGATASGKTALSIAAAKHLGGEIVSADSMQIYRYMDIGTAKPTLAEREGIPHYLLDEITPDESFSVAEYVKRAHVYIRDIHERGRLPIVVGGTGLYIDSLIRDVDFPENDSDCSLRSELNALAEREGAEPLLKMLAELDPVSAQRLHPNNLRRIVRAIEFCKCTGVPISEHQERTRQKQSRYEPLLLAVKWDMPTLYERINKRVDIMLENGLVDEVKGLVSLGYENAVLAMQGIGYKEILAYLRGETTLDEAAEKIKLNSRHYAKRQMTWFKRNDKIIWLDAGEGVRERALELMEKSGIAGR